MPEITLIVDDLRGAMLVEDNAGLSSDAVAHLRETLGAGREIGCARPLEISAPPFDFSEHSTGSISVRIAGFYHDSLTEGPGRRSSVLFQYCPLRCKGFIYSLKWEKYYITHDRTEPTTYCNQCSSPKVARTFSSGFSRRASREHRSGLSSGFGKVARLLRFSRDFAACGAPASDYRVCSI